MGVYHFERYNIGSGTIQDVAGRTTNRDNSDPRRGVFPKLFTPETAQHDAEAIVSVP